MSFIEELKRRNVFRVGIAYLVGAWILVQVADILFENIGTPGWVMQTLLVFLGLGFFVALFFAWAFEMTPEGIRKESEVDRTRSITSQTASKLNSTIVVLLVLAVAYLLFDKFSGRGKMGSEPFSQETTQREMAEMGSEPFSRELEQQADGPANGKRDPTPAESPVVAAKPANKSIAVLPFTNRSPNADDIYFTDGVHDDLLTKLAKLNAFSVISRTSVMEYRDTAKNLKQVAQELGVATIMEGAVQRAGNRVRINVQLIDAKTDEHLWAEIYDREMTTDNLFDIQSEIAQAIATAMQATLSTEEVQSVSTRPTSNVAAYELYLQAQRYDFGETEAGFRSAIDLYSEALRLDPAFKQAGVGLANAYMNLYWSFGGDTANRQAARDAIDQVASQDPEFPDLFMAEGFYWYWGFLDYDRAITNLKKAIRLMPGNAKAHMWLGWASRRAGEWDQALASMAESQRLNPRDYFHWLEYSQTLNYTGHVKEAFEAANKMLALNPNTYSGKLHTAWLYLDRTDDIHKASELSIGAQFSESAFDKAGYFETQLITRHFDNAVESARTWPTEVEIDLIGFNLKEMKLANVLLLQGDIETSREQAQAALVRLAELEREFPGDFRNFYAQCQMQAILGNQQATLELAEKTLASKHPDTVLEFNLRYTLARSMSVAGLPEQAIEMLDQMLSKPSGIHVPYIEKDPFFDGIRNTPEFIALLSKYR